MEAEKKLIILVDDNPANLRVGKNVLAEHYAVATTPSAEKMFALLENNSPALILLDIDMPEMSGYEAIKILKGKPETKDIPVIFLTGKTESDDELEGLSLGAIDYITKPFQPALLLKRIEVHLLVETQRKILRKAFSTYLSEDVVEEIIADPTRLQLGGIQRRMTALFTDIRHFTHIATVLSPDKLVDLLNKYLSAMSNVILEQNGTIDKYVGDAIISFFGAPLELPDHALRACVSGITMKRLEGELNKEILAEGLSPEPLFSRIGINSGDMVVGNMGTEQKMNYTIMGNAVNLASRLEGINRQYGTWILAAESTIKECAGHVLARRIDCIRVKGISEPLRIYELLALSDDAPAGLKEQAEVFEAALDIFEKRNWTAAETAFAHLLEKYPGDGPVALYLDRCRQYRQSPPAADWDGVFSFTSK